VAFSASARSAAFRFNSLILCSNYQHVVFLAIKSIMGHTETNIKDVEGRYGLGCHNQPLLQGIEMED